MILKRRFSWESTSVDKQREEYRRYVVGSQVLVAGICFLDPAANAAYAEVAMTLPGTAGELAV